MKQSQFIPISVALLFVLSIVQPAGAQTVFINEFMASNSITITDPDYKDYADWIELFNAGDSSLNLKGYSITDLLSQPKKYVFTADVVIPAKGYKLIWADDRATANHANFKLSASGESIGLFSPSGQVVDSITFGAQQNDISYGRFPNGAVAWYKMSPSSPGTPNVESQIADKIPLPIVSLKSGFYPGNISVSLTHTFPNVSLRYTIDGHTPTPASPLYSSPIAIDSTLVLRVKAFKVGSPSSSVLTSTYFINEGTTLPVFSLVTDPENFFSDTSGIYVAGTSGIIDNCSTAPRNWNQDWERPIDIELFEKTRQSAFSVASGVKIFGGCARLYAEKSLAFYFRYTYGFDKLNYRLFPDQLITEYNNFVLRSGGQDWWRTMYRDEMGQMLIKGAMNIDYQDYRPSVVFTNGQYWGIHNVREKLNEHYIESHYGIDGNNVDVIDISKAVSANNGDTLAYKEMIDFLTANSPAVAANYDHIRSIVDIDNYIDYNIAEIYYANGDWPGSNMKLWRERTAQAKWRWMISDLDFTFGGNAEGMSTTNTLVQATATNGPSWPNPPWATMMLRRMLENTDFRNEFIQRFAVHMNTTFDKDRVLFMIDSLGAAIAAEIPRHKARWPQSISIGNSPVTWTGNVQIMKDFAVARAPAMRGFIQSKFGLTGTYNLTITRNDSMRGKIFAHTVELRKNATTHLYFKNVPLSLKAVSLPGFRFVRWEGVSPSTLPEITVLLNADATMTAVFEPIQLSVTSVVINEINYKSSPLFDTEDWIELYNPANGPVDVSGWKFRDDHANEFTFPPLSSIGGRSYLVLARDTTKFLSLRSSIRPVAGGFGFGLMNEGQKIQLTDDAGNIVDEVAYGSTGKWSPLPNGTGATLALTNPQGDNSLPEQWKPSLRYGTPGNLNDVYSTLQRRAESLPEDYELFNNYPNPFNPSTTIRFYLPERVMTDLTIHNQLGQRVRQLVHGILGEGMHQVDFNAERLASGMYFYELATPKYRNSKKLILLK
ncbi:MAG: CotH kinase family protein [Ignavibacteriales bacterium]|nr:CotH kinase family protein [Ignavibacteriales bacterium]